MMKENEFSSVGKFLTTFVVILTFVLAAINIIHGEVRSPLAFAIVLVGCGFFVVAKLSVILKRQWVSFGSGPMTETMANCYRIGYWLMALGILLTFA